MKTKTMYEYFYELMETARAEMSQMIANGVYPRNQAGFIQMQMNQSMIAMIEILQKRAKDSVINPEKKEEKDGKTK